MDVLIATLNPCVDETIFEGGEPSLQSGGKGVNVARVLSALGASCACVAPVGGADGRLFEALARSEGVPLVAVPIESETRRVVTRVRMPDYAQTVARGRSPSMSESELRKLRGELVGRMDGARCLAICGSACCDGAAKMAPELIGEARRRGLATLLDSNGEALRLGVRAAPDLIKPNLAELSFLAGRALEDGDAENAARALLEQGVGAALVSLGARGAAYVRPESTLYCPAPRVEPVNPVGSGDCFTAGFLYALLRRYSDERALTIACAAGAANARVFPAARIRADDIEKLLGFSLA